MKSTKKQRMISLLLAAALLLGLSDIPARATEESMSQNSLAVETGLPEKDSGEGSYLPADSVSQLPLAEETENQKEEPAIPQNNSHQQEELEKEAEDAVFREEAEKEQKEEGSAVLDGNTTSSSSESDDTTSSNTVGSNTVGSNTVGSNNASNSTVSGNSVSSNTTETGIASKEEAGKKRITHWSWVEAEGFEGMIDPQTNTLPLIGVNERNPVDLETLLTVLPTKIQVVIKEEEPAAAPKEEKTEETVTLSGWSCEEFPIEGAGSGSFVFTALLPEGYGLAEDTPALALTVELGGAAVYTEDTYSLTVTGGAEGTDYARNHSMIDSKGDPVTESTAEFDGAITILKDTGLTISGTWNPGASGTEVHYGEVIYIPEGVTANVTLDNATIEAGKLAAPITVAGTLNLKLVGTNTLKLHSLKEGVNGSVGTFPTPGIFVLSEGELTIDGEETAVLNIQTGNKTESTEGNAAIGGSYRYSGASGRITINGGILNVTSAGASNNSSASYFSGAAIGGAAARDFKDITINGGVINAVSYSGAAIGGGFTAYNLTGKVTINGGTVYAIGGETAYYGQEVNSDGAGGPKVTGGVTINGGSVNNKVRNNRPLSSDNKPLYMAAVSLHGVQSPTRVTEVRYYLEGQEITYGAGNIYAYKDMKTDTSGNLYLWLPQGAVVASVTAGGSIYTGNLLVAADDSAKDIFYQGATYRVHLQSSYPNLEVSLPYGNTYVANTTVYVQAEAHSGYVLTGIGTAPNPGSYNRVEGNLYSFTMPASDVTLYLEAEKVDLPETLDLSHGDITFGYNETLKCRYVTYFTSGGEKTVNYIPAEQVYNIIQSNSGTATKNTIQIQNWDSFSGDQLPLKLTVTDLNINADEGEQGSETLTKSLIDMDGSTVELTLKGASRLTSNAPYYGSGKPIANNRMKALLSVSGDSALTITSASGNHSLTATAEAGYAAVIGGDSDNSSTPVDCGIINIQGGKLTASISSKHSGGAAIGSGYKGRNGEIYIAGGEVEATTGNWGAAIGGGRGSTGYKVNISGGQVTATAIGESRGAAIGSGRGSAASMAVKISGGEITAVSEGEGAAIGSGEDSDGSITITGGKIAAITYYEGAAIGSGSNSAENTTVVITGGEITANSSGDSIWGAAIGSGYSSNADIRISGGNINATGSEKTPAIGGARGNVTGTITNVTINGGNINIKNSTAATIGNGNFYTGTKVTITGGSIHGVKRNTDKASSSITNENNQEVYLITATLPQRDTEVSGSIVDQAYSFNGVKTNSAGILYLWLPESTDSSPTKATLEENDYTGVVKTDDTGIFTSDKTIPTVTAPVSGTLTYNGSEQPLVTAGAVDGGTLQYALGTDNLTIPGNNSWKTTIPTALNAGTYYVWYKVLGNDTYGNVGAKCVSVNIAPKMVDRVSLGKDFPTEYPYTGAEIKPEIKTLYDGDTNTLIPANQYQVVYDSNPAVNPKEYWIGFQTVEGGNYTFHESLATRGCTYKIKKAEPQIIWGNTANTTEYSGKPANLSATIEMKSNAAPGSLTYSYTGTAKGQEVNGTGLPTNAGSYTITASYEGDENHEAVSKATALTIKKLPLTIKAQDHTITYKDAPAANGVTYLGFINQENEGILKGTLTYGYSYAQGMEVGSYTITPQGVTADNYDITFVPGTLTVTKAAFSPTLPTATAITYGQTLSASTLSDGWQWKEKDTVPENTSQHQAWYQVDTKNYTCSDPDFDEATGKVTKEVMVGVTKAVPTLTLSHKIAGRMGSRQVTLTAALQKSGSGRIPTGTVQFVKVTGSTTENLGTAISVDADGKAVYVWTPEQDGEYTLKAVYSGDNYYEPNAVQSQLNTLKQEQKAPSAFTLTFTLNEDGETYTATIPAVTNGSYSFDGVTWSETNTKTDCQPNTPYTGYVKYKETETHRESEATAHTQVTPRPQIKAPVITRGETFTGSKQVEISCPASRVTIYYTLDGSEPSVTATEYTGPFTLRASAIVRAIAIRADGSMENSQITQQVFPLQGDADYQQRVQEFPLTEAALTEDLKALGITTPTQIVKALEQVVATKAGGKYQQNVEVWDVKLQFSLDGGKTWINATEENFPTEGITTTLPYPAGTGKESHNFFVTHMFTVTSARLNTKAGDTEEPAVTKTAEGVQITLKGLSPVAIAYEKAASSGSGGGNTGGGDGGSDTDAGSTESGTSGGSTGSSSSGGSTGSGTVGEGTEVGSTSGEGTGNKRGKGGSKETGAQKNTAISSSETQNFSSSAKDAKKESPKTEEEAERKDGKTEEREEAVKVEDKTEEEVPEETGEEKKESSWEEKKEQSGKEGKPGENRFSYWILLLAVVLAAGYLITRKKKK